MGVNIFTKDQRKETCIHESAHAVITALCGEPVYSVAVAPEGARIEECLFIGRTGGRHNAVGLCDGSDGALWLCRWDDEECALAVDHEQKREYLKNFPKAMRSTIYRSWRGRLCNCLAGEIAEAYHSGEGMESFWLEDYGSSGSDTASAWGYHRLLPFRDEINHAIEITKAAIVEYWPYVTRLAEVLEERGQIDDDVVDYLPEKIPNWPPSPMAAGSKGVTAWA
jgi:hypothetical protein